MSSPVFYYDASPCAANIPLPSSPYASPYASPYVSPYSSPQGSPYGVHIALPPSPVAYSLSVPLPPSPVLRPTSLPPVHNPLPPPPEVLTATQIASHTAFEPHPLLALDAQNPAIQWDVRCPPDTARIDAPGTYYPPLSRSQLAESALSPPWTFVRLRSPLLPWLIEVSSARGVTVGDVLRAVYSCLRERVDKAEWRDQTREFQSYLLEAWTRRCNLAGHEDGRAARLREQDRGVRRVDWLLYDTEWLGIERSKTELETWDVHFRSL